MPSGVSADWKHRVEDDIKDLRRDVDRNTKWINWAIGGGFVGGIVLGLFAQALLRLI